MLGARNELVLVATATAVFFEFKHYKHKKKKISTRCFCFMEMDEIKEGNVALEMCVFVLRERTGVLCALPFFVSCFFVVYSLSNEQLQEANR